jgi:hypothetical protein
MNTSVLKSQQVQTLRHFYRHGMYYRFNSKVAMLTPILFSPILQTAMFSGTWYIVIEGLTFAYVRTFTLTVGVPTTITVSDL